MPWPQHRPFPPAVRVSRRQAQLGGATGEGELSVKIFMGITDLDEFEKAYAKELLMHDALAVFQSPVQFKEITISAVVGLLEVTRI